MSRCQSFDCLCTATVVGGPAISREVARWSDPIRFSAWDMHRRAENSVSPRTGSTRNGGAGRAPHLSSPDKSDPNRKRCEQSGAVLSSDHMNKFGSSLLDQRNPGFACLGSLKGSCSFPRSMCRISRRRARSSCRHRTATRSGSTSPLRRAHPVDEPPHLSMPNWRASTLIVPLDTTLDMAADDAGPAAAFKSDDAAGPSRDWLDAGGIKAGRRQDRQWFSGTPCRPAEAVTRKAATPRADRASAAMFRKRNLPVRGRTLC